MPRFVVGAMLDGAGEKDGSEGRGVIGEATLTRGVETLSGAFKTTVLIVLDRAPTAFFTPTFIASHILMSRERTRMCYHI